MSEKTALELVDELIAMMGCPSPGQLIKLKSAIEREEKNWEDEYDALLQISADRARIIADLTEQLKSAIVMRPISELPDRVPDGCWLCLVGPDYFYSGFIPGLPGAVSELATHFIIVPRPPKPARRLHPCYMPGCGKEVVTAQASIGGYFVSCSCGASGPVKDDEEAAKQAWGYAE